MKKLLILAILAVNIQWHYNRMCATVFSPRAYFKLDGVYCETSLDGIEFKLTELLERHQRVQEQQVDPRYIPPSTSQDT